jgi:hypothetical protein
MLPHVGPTTSLRTVILRGDRGLAHTVAMIEVTCDVSFGSWLCKNVLAEALTSGGDPGRGGRVR